MKGKFRKKISGGWDENGHVGHFFVIFRSLQLMQIWHGNPPKIATQGNHDESETSIQAFSSPIPASPQMINPHHLLPQT